MGIKEFNWKIIIGAMFSISAIITIATNIKFVLNCLSLLWNLFVRILVNPIVRDILLLALIVGILIWLIFISKKLKKPLKIDDGQFINKVESLRDEHLELKKNIEDLWEGKYKPKEDEKLKWKGEHQYVLGKIAKAKYEVGLETVFKDYQKEFRISSRIEYKCIIDDLIRLRLIRHTCNTRKEPYYQITREGLDYFT